MLTQNRSQTAGLVGMFGALFFFVGLLIEYRYDLFSPGSGMLYTLNQLQFFVAMTCILVLLWAVRGETAVSLPSPSPFSPSVGD